MRLVHSWERAKSISATNILQIRTQRNAHKHTTGNQRPYQSCPISGCFARVIELKKHITRVHKLDPAKLEQQSDPEPVVESTSPRSSAVRCVATVTDNHAFVAGVHPLSEGLSPHPTAADTSPDSPTTLAPRPYTSPDGPTLLSTTAYTSPDGTSPHLPKANNQHRQENTTSAEDPSNVPHEDTSESESQIDAKINSIIGAYTDFLKTPLGQKKKGKLAHGMHDSCGLSYIKIINQLKACLIGVCSTNTSVRQSRNTKHKL